MSNHAIALTIGTAQDVKSPEQPVKPSPSRASPLSSSSSSNDSPPRMASFGISRKRPSSFRSSRSTCRDTSRYGMRRDGRIWMIRGRKSGRSGMTCMVSAIIWGRCRVGTVSARQGGADVDTAFVKSAKGWYYCEDSKISPAQDKDVVVSRLLPLWKKLMTD